MALKLCPGCNRHARAELTACPFCGRDLPTVGSAKVGIGMALGVALVACGPSVALPDAADGTTTMPTTPGPGSSAAASDTEVADDGGFDTGSTSIDHYDSCGDSCCGFYGGCWDGDAGGPIECDVLGQDCFGDFMRCAPWSNNGEASWNATKCTVLHPRPRQVGETCKIEGSAFSGVDDCDAGLACFGVDASTLEGKCVELCDQDTCSVEGMTCIGLHGFIGGCFEPCDLLAPECGELEGCYPFDDDEAGCASDGSGDAGRQGDACGWVTDCAPGFVCVPAEQVAGEGTVLAGKVCTTLCDPAGEEPCGEMAELQCMPLTGDPSVGACRLP